MQFLPNWSIFMSTPEHCARTDREFLASSGYWRAVNILVLAAALIYNKHYNYGFAFGVVGTLVVMNSLRLDMISSSCDKISALQNS